MALIDIYEMLTAAKISATEFILPKGYSSNDYKEFYNCYRRLVLDSELPITCVVGYSLESKELVYNTFAQLSGTTMSYLEMVKALRTFRFYSTGEKTGRLCTRRLHEPFNSTNIQFTRECSLLPLIQSEDIIPDRSGLILQLWYKTKTGSCAIQENVQSGSSLTPLPTYHSLQEFFRILRLEGNTIVQKVDSRVILENFHTMLLSVYIPEEVEKDAVQFGQIPLNEVFNKLRGDLPTEYNRTITTIQNSISRVEGLPQTLNGLVAYLRNDLQSDFYIDNVIARLRSICRAQEDAIRYVVVNGLIQIILDGGGIL